MPRAIRKLQLWDRQEKNIIARRTKSEMEQLIGSQEAIKFCGHCGTRRESKKSCYGTGRPHDWRYRATDLFFKKDNRTAAALTARDAQANAGIGSKKAVEAAQDRVSKWREQGDHRSPLPNYEGFKPVELAASPVIPSFSR